MFFGVCMCVLRKIDYIVYKLYIKKSILNYSRILIWKYFFKEVFNFLGYIIIIFNWILTSLKNNGYLNDNLQLLLLTFIKYSLLTDFTTCLNKCIQMKVHKYHTLDFICKFIIRVHNIIISIPFLSIFLFQ